jgi:hypothetical protein
MSRRRGKTPSSLFWAGFLTGFLLLGSWARAQTVIFHLKNGDRVSGVVESENADRVILKSPVAGKLKIPKSNIEKRETPAAPTTATAKPAATNPPPPVATAPKPSAATGGTNAVAVMPAAPSWWETAWLRPFLTNWHGNLQLGMDLGFGTADHQTYYGNFSALHTYQRLRNNLEYHAAYGFANSALSANRMDGAVKTDVDLGQKRRLYVYNQAAAGYDEIRRVDLQFSEGAGVGYKILQKPRLVLNGETGAQWQRFDYTTAPDREVISVRLGENLTWSPVPKLSIIQKAAFMPNVEDVGDYRARFELSLGYPVFKKVTINLNVIDEYDSAPPPNVSENSLQVQSTIGVVF